MVWMLDEGGLACERDQLLWLVRRLVSCWVERALGGCSERGDVVKGLNGWVRGCLLRSDF